MTTTDPGSPSLRRREPAHLCNTTPHRQPIPPARCCAPRPRGRAVPRGKRGSGSRPLVPTGVAAPSNTARSLSQPCPLPPAAAILLSTRRSPPQHVTGKATGPARLLAVALPLWRASPPSTCPKLCSLRLHSHPPASSVDRPSPQTRFEPAAAGLRLADILWPARSLSSRLNTLVWAPS